MTSGRRNISLYQLSYGVRGLRQDSNLQHKWSISCIHRKCLKKRNIKKCDDKDLAEHCALTAELQCLKGAGGNRTPVRNFIKV